MRKTTLRGLLALTLAAAAATPAVPQAARPAARTDWTKTVAWTPLGGLRIGNPAAPVQLIEYGSYTCPACKLFKDQGLATLLSRYVATGRVSFEFRSLPIHGAVDVALTQLAACQTPTTAWTMTTAAYARQQAVKDAFVKVPEATFKRAQSVPTEQAILLLADAGGIDDFALSLGVPKPRFAQCMTAKAGLAKLEASGREAQAYGIASTPSFILNGRVQEGISDWGSLRQLLDAALE